MMHKDKLRSGFSHIPKEEWDRAFRRGGEMMSPRPEGVEQQVPIKPGKVRPDWMKPGISKWV